MHPEYKKLLDESNERLALRREKETNLKARKDAVTLVKEGGMKAWLQALFAPEDKPAPLKKKFPKAWLKRREQAVRRNAAAKRKASTLTGTRKQTAQERESQRKGWHR